MNIFGGLGRVEQIEWRVLGLDVARTKGREQTKSVKRLTHIRREQGQSQGQEQAAATGTNTGRLFRFPLIHMFPLSLC